MCENIFKNQEEKKRREDFTKLFTSLVTNATLNSVVMSKKRVKAGK